MKLKQVMASLHEHLRTSSRMKNFNRIVDKAKDRLGEGGIVGLINFNDERYERFSELTGYAREFIGKPHSALRIVPGDLLIVKGQEVPTQQGHVLIVGLPYGMQLKTGKNLDYTLDEADEFKAIKIIDHPFFIEGLGPFLESNPQYIKRFNAVEVFNGNAELYIPKITNRGANKKALEFYSRHNYLFPLISTDGHSGIGIEFQDEFCKSFSYLQVPYSSYGGLYDWMCTNTDINKTLRQGLEKHIRPSVLGMTNTAKLGALNHLIDLGIITGLSKIGIKV